MPKYIVLKPFYDRFNNMKLCRSGEEHVPPNEERAKQLVEQGFIKLIESEHETTQQVESEKKKPSKKRVKDNGKETESE